MMGCRCVALFFFLALLVPPPAAGRSWAGAQEERKPKDEGLVGGLLAAMTDEELVSLLHGVESNFTYSGLTSGVPRLGIPPLALNDGPQGFRYNPRPGSTTAFPSALNVAASFDPALAREWAGAIAEEFRGKGSNVMLGPAVQAGKVPNNGRRFEYLGGEDPCLGAAMVGPVVEAIQAKGVLACAKHYVMNQQEAYRGDVAEIVDERTAWQMYLPPFLAAVEAGVASFMCSYNKVNMGPGDAGPVYACESAEALRVDLKERMGFTGWVMSDWGATHSTAAAALAGLDQEMPNDRYFGKALLDAVSSGAVPRARLEDMAGRVLRQMMGVGLIGPRATASSSPSPSAPGMGPSAPGMGPSTALFDADVTSPEHRDVARRVAASSFVLLKNDKPKPSSSLPSPSTTASASSTASPAEGAGAGKGGGGPWPPPTTGPLPLSPISPGLVVVGDAAHLDPLTIGQGSGAVQAGANTVTPLQGIRGQSRWPVGYVSTGNATAMGDQIRAAAAAVVFVGVTSGEGADRDTLALKPSEDAMVRAVLALQPERTVVVVASPGPVLLPWAPSAPAILMTFMAGEQAGHAIADVLFGRLAPSGRLPVTLPNSDNEVEFPAEVYPGVNVSGVWTSTFPEGREIGYRWYEAHKVAPLYPFGHGLSYVDFAYSALKVTPVQGLGAIASLPPGVGAGAVAATAQLKVSNLGHVAAHEAVQLYVGFPPAAGEPPVQLRDFERVRIRGGGAATVTLTLRVRDLCVWDVEGHAWAPVRGTFRLLVGASSRDIRLEGSLPWGV